MSARYPKGGAQKQREKKDQQKQLDELLKKTPKLQSFWTTNVQASEATSSSSADVDCDVSMIVQVPGSPAVGLQQAVKVEGEDLSDNDEQSSIKIDCSFPDDVGLWLKVTDELANFWIKQGSLKCQHFDDDFNKSARKIGNETRICPKTLFTRVHPGTGESLRRSWLCYSPSTGRVYCFACKLLSADLNSFATDGFAAWQNAQRDVSRHENGDSHRGAMMALVSRSQMLGRIDSDIVKQMQSRIDYWCNVLHRIIAVVKFLAERGLSFRGQDEIFGSTHNGNYLGTLELLAQFDPFLANHLHEHGNKGKGRISYLSSTICEEFIQLMGQQVFNKIVQEIKHAKYFSVSLDSTPDISHVDQLTCVFRYVLDDGPVERFFTFLDMHGHTGEQLAASLISFMEDNDIHISNCRGQSYDNASNMSGKYKGVQALIRSKNPLADYIPCVAHSLNLVGKCAAESCSQANSFFDFVQSLYVFFSRSTHRWSILVTAMSTADAHVPVLKQLSETRWSARADATSALLKGFTEIRLALCTMRDAVDEKMEVRKEAEGLARRMDTLELGIMTSLWAAVMERFNKTSMFLQGAQLDLNTAVKLLTSLVDYVQSIRSRFEEFEAYGKKLSGTDQYKEERSRKRQRNTRNDDGDAPDTVMSASDTFKTGSFYVIIDRLSSELHNRKEAYSQLRDRFGFLSVIEQLSVDDIAAASSQLIECYPADLEDSLADEWVQFVSFARPELLKQQQPKPSESGDDNKISNELLMYQLLKTTNLDETFPNVEITLRIYLCMMVTACSGERSFSKLKRIKNELRSTMKQSRLNMLSLMSIEHTVLRQIDFSDIISEFASRKARKYLK